MAEPRFSVADREAIERRGLDEATVRRQLELLRDPPPPAELIAPATPGHGVVVLSEDRHAELLGLHAEAAAAGRFSKLVPASGAASRMFKALAAVRRGEGTASDEEACDRFFAHLDRFPFGDQLRGGDRQAVLARLLDDDGLGYVRIPKGLLPFHRHGETTRSPFAEHLVEAAAHVRSADGRCRVHFTVTAEHEASFRAAFAAFGPALEAELDTRFDLGFSFQEPSTDTVAAHPDGRPFHDAQGRLLFRPGGHGALLGNLERLGGDLVYVKNVDNVVPDARRDVVVLWKKLLGGYLVALERRLAEVLGRADDGSDGGFTDAALAFFQGDLGTPVDEATLPAGTAREEALRDRLERPLRVCGVVPVADEPGGGPFWVRDRERGTSLQIVETSQIDQDDPEQAAILARGTHFNPVDLVCRLRDHRGRPFALERFVDPRTAFVSSKFDDDGQPLLALEHPGLWNGSMARWNTVFVEVPAATFAPVKTVLDLLRPEHQDDA